MKQHIRAITTQRKWGRQRSAKGSAPPVSAPGVTKIGYQLWYGDYWADAIYADLMHTSTPDWAVLYGANTTVGVDQYGWLDALPAGATYVNVVTTQQGEGNWYDRRGGVYVATWTHDPNLTVSLTGNYAESVVSGGRLVSPGRYECTVSQTAPGSNGGTAWILNAQVTNSGAAPAVFNSLKVFHIEDESRINAGQVLTSKHVDKLAGCGVVRVMLCIGSNTQDSHGWNWQTPSVKANDVLITNWATPQHRIWRGDDMPPEVAAMVANELNADLYLPLPTLCTDATLTSYATKVYGILNSNLRVHIEPSNEATWNYAVPYAASMAYLGYVLGPTLTGVVNTNGAPASDVFSRASCAGMYVAANMWRNFEEIFPRNRVVRVAPGWAAGIGQDGDGYAGLRYIEPVSGVSGAQLADEFAIAPYMNRAFGETAKQMKEARRHEATDLTFMYDAVRSSFSTVQGWTDAHVAKLATVAPGVKLTTYEGGYEVQWALNSNAGAAWTINSDAASDTLGNNYYGFTWALAPGEQIRVSNVGASGLDEHTLYYVKFPTTTSIRVYSTLANYNSDTYVTLTDATGISIQNYSQCDGYAAFILTADNTLNAYTNEDFANAFDTGEGLRLASAAGTALNTYTTYYLRKVSTTKMTLHPTLADATNNTNILSLAGGNNVMVQFDNKTRMEALAQKFYDMITSQFGADLYAEYFAIFDGKIELLMQHVPFGNIYPAQTSAVLKQAWSAYSPQMTAMRALAIARKGSV
jgi:hypothetical protein